MGSLIALSSSLPLGLPLAIAIVRGHLRICIAYQLPSNSSMRRVNTYSGRMNGETCASASSTTYKLIDAFTLTKNLIAFGAQQKARRKHSPHCFGQKKLSFIKKKKRWQDFEYQNSNCGLKAYDCPPFAQANYSQWPAAPAERRDRYIVSAICLTYTEGMVKRWFLAGFRGSRGIFDPIFYQGPMFAEYF